MESGTFTNSSFIPAAAMDFLLAFPRLAQRAGSLAFYHMPEAVDNIAGKIFNGGSMIADATGRQIMNSTIANTNGGAVQSTAAAAMDGTFSQALREGGAEASTSMVAMLVHFVHRLKNFGGIFSYLTSKWAMTTFAVAIILNRTQFYASSREHLRLRWYMRLMLYLVPVSGFIVQMLYILQALKCQTSPDFALLRYGDPLKHLAIDFGADGGFLYKLSSTILFWQDDASCCAARNMSIVALGDDRSQLRGSMSLLFIFFLTLCTSQFFETLSCALQGKQPAPETGMTLFEHSLAFAECEAMISNALGFDFFGSSTKEIGGSTPDSAAILLTRGEILQRLNVPPEVLLVCLISCFSHLCSATLAVIGLRHRVRLVNTGIWACCYMAAFVWSFAKIFWSPVENITALGVLRFPTVCIVGFIPHVLILFGIIVCGSIYGLALLTTALSVPAEVSQGMSFRQRIAWAYQNLQANVQFSSSSNIRIRMSEDFYTALLKIGFTILTAASEAVYLNEGSRIQVAQMTWVEQKRIDEMASDLDKRATPAVPSELLDEGIARGVEFSDHQNAAVSFSPYARERKSKSAAPRPERATPGELDTGLGLVQRRNRVQLTMDFISGLFWLVTNLLAQVVIRGLRRIGVERRPSWLLKAAGIQPNHRKALPNERLSKTQERDFWILGPDGRPTRPQNSDVDVEAEMKRTWLQSGIELDDDAVSSKLYHWWQGGGWFGDLDESGDFSATEDEDDTTSVISMSTNASVADDDSDVDEDGRQTPTQRRPYGTYSREGTPESESGLDISLLSRLLNPHTAADREEARLLSYSLQAGQPMTRSKYRRDQNQKRAQLLTGLRGSAAQSSQLDEERDLERFILSQRSKAKSKTPKNTTWETGAEGMGAGGPQCVVCQSTPRTILVWPCGCLSMCDDCRIGLAARNYTKCICCRTEVAAYSRLYVP